MKVKCTNEDCEHEWDYKGKAIHATCPSCLRKVRVEERSEE